MPTSQQPLSVVADARTITRAEMCTGDVRTRADGVDPHRANGGLSTAMAQLRGDGSTKSHELVDGKRAPAQDTDLNNWA